MKCTYTSKNGQLKFEFEATDAQDLFLQRSVVELHDEEACAVCGGKNIRCEVRKSGEYVFYEMRCQNRACNARLEFGQNKDMKNLFCKRSEHAKTNGWFVYQGPEQEHDEALPQPAAASSAKPNGGPKTPTPTKATAAASSPPPGPIVAGHVKQALDGMAAAKDSANLDQWLKWAKSIQGTNDEQKRQLDEAFQATRTRLMRPIARR